MRSLRLSVCALCSLLLASCTSMVPKTPGTADFVPFTTFLQGVRSARYEDSTGRDVVKVRDQAAFEEMRAHILKMYDGVQPVHTFVSDGALFDCIAIASQPAVRVLGLTQIERPPPASAVAGAYAAGRTRGNTRAIGSPLRLGLRGPLRQPHGLRHRYDPDGAHHPGDHDALHHTRRLLQQRAGRRWRADGTARRNRSRRERSSVRRRAPRALDELRGQLVAQPVDPDGRLQPLAAVVLRRCRRDDRSPDGGGRLGRLQGEVQLGQAGAVHLLHGRQLRDAEVLQPAVRQVRADEQPLLSRRRVDELQRDGRHAVGLRATPRASPTVARRLRPRPIRR